MIEAITAEACKAGSESEVKCNTAKAIISAVLYVTMGIIWASEYNFSCLDSSSISID